MVVAAQSNLAAAAGLAGASSIQTLPWPIRAHVQAAPGSTSVLWLVDSHGRGHSADQE